MAAFGLYSYPTTKDRYRAQVLPYITSLGKSSGYLPDTIPFVFSYDDKLGYCFGELYCDLCYDGLKIDKM